MAEQEQDKPRTQLDALLASDAPDGALDAEEGAQLSALWDSLSPRIEAQDASWLGRLRARSTRARLGLAALIALSMCAATVVFTPRPELLAYPRSRMALVLAALALLLALALRVALRPLHRPNPSAAGVLALLLASVAAVITFALLPEAHTLLPHTAPLPDQTLWDRARPCLVFGLGMGAPVFVAVRALDRGPRRTLWFAAASLGLSGNLALQLHCPLTNADHLLAGHASVVVVAIAAVALALFALRPRPAS